MAKVLDTAALIDFFKDSGAANAVEATLVQAERNKKRVMISSLTLAELYCLALASSKEKAETLLNEVALLPIEVVGDDAGYTLLREATRFRVNKNINDWSDCFAAAIAKVRRAELLTTRKELLALGGEIKVLDIGGTHG